MTWREFLIKVMENYQESLEDIVSIAPSDLDMDLDFDESFGGIEGTAFTIWTKNRVYFPVVYDGSEWVDSVSRNPDGIATNHVGEG